MDATGFAMPSSNKVKISIKSFAEAIRVIRRSFSLNIEFDSRDNTKNIGLYAALW